MQDSAAAFLALLLTIWLLAVLRAKRKDPYGLYHLEWNHETGEDVKSAPKSEWMNHGYWKIHFLKHAEVELTAAAFSDISPLLTALAIKLCQAAKLEGGENILDVGHGTGESLVMFLTDEALPRPSQLTGITSLPSQCNRARNRISQIQRSKDVARNTQVDIYCGDAVCQDTTSPAHPLHSLNAAKFDVIYVLDCAYHFATRRQFLAQAFRKLTPGGRIVLADICYSADGVPTTATKFLTTQIMGFMPGENMVSKKQYVRELEEIGYQDVVLEDITEEAFRGTWEFLASKGELWSLYAKYMGWYRDAVELRYVVVSGRKPE